MSTSVQSCQGVQIIGMLIRGVLRIFENAAKRATEKYRGALVCLYNVDILEESNIRIGPRQSGALCTVIASELLNLEITSFGYSPVSTSP